MMQIATFGAGCFWGVEDAFRQIDGVIKTEVGYSGGMKDNPSYEDVCSGVTGHAEVVRIEYDPEKVNYTDLLNVFWKIHDPTQYNRQGPDVGTQYRSVIFTHSPEQEQAALQSKKELQESSKYTNDIVTSIEPAQPFWRAEDYHQQYNEKNSRSCHITF